MPALKAVKSAVTSTTDSANASWNAGPSALSPPCTAAREAVATAPSASTTQRYLGGCSERVMPSSLGTRPYVQTGVTGLRLAGRLRSRPA